ncbi:XkdQ/YqbQ family protein [Enterococcus sp. DIV1420a]|uniref:XkdQ/YqbQ family protein n=1 Tax=Enterococcus sp. DIV1420a TaxID=2774672 RepID=UPI003F20980B
MKLQLLETSINNGEQYDLSEIVSFPTWTTSIESQPGTLEFEMLADPKVFLLAGDIIELRIDGKVFFKGKVFNRSKGKEKSWRIIAYDATRYLKNEDTLIFPASTASNRFTTICQTQGIPHKVLDHATYNCAPVVEDKHTYYSMLEEALEETRKNHQIRYGFWDRAGTLEFFDFNRMITKLVIGDNSLMTDYDYEASIDDAANSVKVMREDKEQGKREIFTAQHNEMIDKWGKLQIVETVNDAELNSAQLQQQAQILLGEKNKEVKTLRIEAIGHLGIRAGNSFILRMKDLGGDSIGNDNLALVKNCKHNFANGHTMSLQVEVIR